MNRRIIATAAVLGACVVAAFAHEGHKAEASRGVVRVGEDLYLTEQVKSAAGLTFREVELGTIEQTLEARARLFAPPERRAFASTRVAGRLVEVRVLPGDAVERGAVLGIVDSLELEAKERALLQAKDEFERERVNLERVHGLAAAQNVAEKDVIAAELAAELAQARLDGVRRSLSVLGIDDATLDHLLESGEFVTTLPIRSPIAGRVLHVDARVGQVVEPTEHLFHVADLSVLRLDGALPEDRSEIVRAGMTGTARFSAGERDRRAVVVDRVLPRLDQRDRTLHFLAEVCNADGALRPEMTGVVRLVLEHVEDAVVAPLPALVRRGAETFAFAEEPLTEDDRDALRKRMEVKEAKEAPLPDWAIALLRGLVADPAAKKIARKLVIVGRSSPTGIEITEGLLPGDHVVVAGEHELATFFVQGKLALADTSRRGIGLDTSPAGPRTLDDVESAIARVVAIPGRDEVVAPRVAGKILALHRRAGDAVAPGDPIAEIESSDVVDTSLDLIESSLRLQQLQKTFERVSKLAAARVAAARDLLAAETDWKSEQRRNAGLRRRLSSLGFDEAAIEECACAAKPLSSMVLRATTTGVIADIDVELGQVVRAGESLAEVVDSSRVWLEAALPEAAAARVAATVAARFRPTAGGGRVVEGAVVRIGQEFDPLRRTVPIYVEVDNAMQGLRIGARGELTMVVGRGSDAAIVVPRSAILSESGTAHVVVETDKGFVAVEARLGRSDDRYVEVSSGVFPGDQVIVRGGDQVRTSLSMVR